MKIDFVEYQTAGARILRIFGTDVFEFKNLQAAVFRLSVRDVTEVVVSNLFEAAQAVAVTFKETDQGFYVKASRIDLTWSMAAKEWLLISELLELFVESPQIGTFQWIGGPDARNGLDRCQIPILVSFSTDGCW